MTELVRDIILAAAGLLVLIAVNRARVQETRIPNRVAPFLAIGFALLLFGRVLEMFNTSDLVQTPLSKLLVQEVLGFCVGFVVLAIGLIRWLPATGTTAKRRGRSVNDEKPRPAHVQPPASQKPTVHGEHTVQELMNSILKSSLSGVMVLETVRDDVDDAVDFEVMLMNESAEQILGRSSTNLIGRTLLAEFPCIKAEGLLGNAVSVIETGLPYRSERHFSQGRDSRWYQFVAVKLGDGLAVTFADVSDRKRAEERLRHAAHHDALTGLPNRALFTERLEQAINRAKRFSDYKFAILFLDFDRFKIINDSLGHDAGDQLLMNIAERLRANLRSIDTSSRVADGHLPARLGGDEFVILLDSIHVVRDAVRVAERLQVELAVPHILDGHEVTSTASIGIVTSDLGYEKADDILRDADIAMYRAKMSGRARHVVFDETMHQEVVQRLSLQRDLREAVENKSLELLFDPIVKLESGELTSLEAVIRWSHADRGVVPPAEFVALAEELGLMVPIGEWALGAACRQVLLWHEKFPERANVTIHVNLSPPQLRHPDLVRTVRSALSASGLAPSLLRLELTESMIMHDVAGCTPVLDELTELGVRLVMDDFGRGHSSLGCLHRFPIDVIKIDRHFIGSVKRRRDYGAMVNAVVELAHNLGMEVVAEGVETTGQLALLQALDCDYAQGSLFSEPVPAEQIEARLAGNSRFGHAA